MNNKEVCWKELNRTDRPKWATMKTPYWAEKILRPEKNGNRAILSYEIYGKENYLTEKGTIEALNEIVAEGKAKAFFSQNFVWYVAK